MPISNPSRRAGPAGRGPVRTAGGRRWRRRRRPEPQGECWGRAQRIGRAEGSVGLRLVIRESLDLCLNLGGPEAGGASVTSDDEGDSVGQGGPKGPLLLEKVAPLGGLEEVDGIPGGQAREECWRAGGDEEARRGVVGRAHAAAGSNGEQHGLPREERGRQCGVRRAIVDACGGHGGECGGGDQNAAWLIAINQLFRSHQSRRPDRTLGHTR